MAGGIIDLAGKRVVVFDGAMGTVLQQYSLPANICYEEMNITSPDIIRQIHEKYLSAGSDVITTNTFGANSLKLSNYRKEKKVNEFNTAGVEIARKAVRASGKNAFVAASVGPSGKYLSPLGVLEFDEAYNLFAEQVKALKNADAIIMETFSDLRELKAAVIAAKENSPLPVIAMMTYSKDRTATGTDAYTHYSVMKALGADAVGINCSEGPDEMGDIVRTFIKKSSLPIVVEPNAGHPRLVNGKTVFSLKKEEFVKWLLMFAEEGIEMVGGCCGTTADYIRLLSEKVAGITRGKREVARITTLSSRTKTIEIGCTPVIIGERINPTSRKELMNEIKEGKTSMIRKDALEQCNAGADALDINVGVPGVDEVSMLKKAVVAVQNTVSLPIVIDSSNAKAIEEALKVVEGKALINSVSGEKSSMERILPIAKKYGAAVIGLALDENGVKKSAEERVGVARKIMQNAEKYISGEDIIIDCLTITQAADQGMANETIKALGKIKELNHNTVLGVSNISYGLPNRPLINRTFLSMALDSGLDAAIINPLDAQMMDSINATMLLKNKDIGAKNYLSAYSGYVEARKPESTVAIGKKITNAVIYGDEESIISYVEEALKTYLPLDINCFLINGITEVGVRFKRNEYFLPQVMASAAAMKKAFERLRKELKKGSREEKARIVFATVKNDVHDLGKNIVIALLETKGYNVIDLGKDVDTEKIILAAKENKADVICLSALMTTTIIEMPKVIEGLKKEGMDIPVLVGGAVVTEEFAKSINAAYAADAISAIETVSGLFGDTPRKKFTELLKERKFSLSIEIVPLRNGEDPQRIYERIKKLSKSDIDFMSVTKGAGGSLRGGSLPLVYFSKEKYSIEPIAHFTCRGYNKNEIENALVDHYFFGIKNILALRGDPPAGSTTDKWGGAYKYAWQLVRHIKNMNDGKYLPREGIDKTEFREGIKTDFCIGVAAHPEEKDIELEMEHFRKKVDEGAEFAITQMIFDFDTYKNYVEKARSHGITIPIIAGIRPLTKLSQALSCEDFFKITVPEQLKKKLDTNNEQKAMEEGINYTVGLCRKLRDFGAPGVHFFVLNDVDVAEKIIRMLKTGHA